MNAPARKPWWKVLDVPKDCSTSEARAAYKAALAAVDDTAPDAELQRDLIRSALSQRLYEDGISE